MSEELERWEIGSAEERDHNHKAVVQAGTGSSTSKGSWFLDAGERKLDVETGAERVVGCG